MITIIAISTLLLGIGWGFFPRDIYLWTLVAGAYSLAPVYGMSWSRVVTSSSIPRQALLFRLCHPNTPLCTSVASPTTLLTIFTTPQHQEVTSSPTLRGQGPTIFKHLLRQRLHRRLRLPLLLWLRRRSPPRQRRRYRNQPQRHPPYPSLGCGITVPLQMPITRMWPPARRGGRSYPHLRQRVSKARRARPNQLAKP